MTETAAPNVLKSEVLARFVMETPSEPCQHNGEEGRAPLSTQSAAAAGAVSVEAQRLTAVLRRRRERLGPRETMTPVDGHRAPTPGAALQLDEKHGRMLRARGGACGIRRGEARAPSVTGREFIDAVVIGYDVARRPLDCGAYEPHNGAGFHSTGTCGSFGAAAAVLGLSVRERRCARPCLHISPAASGAACTTARRASACVRAVQAWAA